MLHDLKIHRRSRMPTTEPMTMPAMAPPLRWAASSLLTMVGGRRVWRSRVIAFGIALDGGGIFVVIRVGPADLI